MYILEVVLKSTFIWSRYLFINAKKDDFIHAIYSTFGTNSVPMYSAKDQSLNDLAVTAQWLSTVILHSVYATAQRQ